MSHPLTDALPSYMDANALRQACGEIEERVTRERDEARDKLDGHCACRFDEDDKPVSICAEHLEWKNERDALRAEVERIRAERDTAVMMLAEWCVAVDVGGAGWDEWDDHYKDAAYHPGPLREQIDAAMKAHRELMGYDTQEPTP